MLDRIGRGVDEAHRVGPDRDDGERLVIGRIAHAVNQHLSLVKGPEIAGLRIAEPDHAQQFVVDRICHRYRIGKLLRRVDAVVMADRDIGGGCRAGRLSRPGCG
jgi:hypothetical protein